MIKRPHFILAGAVLVLAGCGTDGTAPTAGSHSTREFAAATETQARKIYANGQASSMDEARAKAAADVNTQWAAERRNADRNASQAQMSRDLESMGYSSK